MPDFKGLSKRLRLKKFLNFFYLLLGKKSKKSFSAMIADITEMYEKEGLIGHEESKMFSNIATFGDKVVNDFMTHRADVVVISYDSTLEDIKKIIINNGHTRIPVFKEDFDDIVGFIHSKDLAKFLCGNPQEFAIEKILRKILLVPGSMKLLDVMLRMRMSRIHAAIVMDEFGGVDGFVTIENVMEEIVGNIEDEHDLPSESSFFRIKKVNDYIFQIGGRVSIERLEEIFQKRIGADDSIETVGGLMMSAFNRIPEIGEEIEKYGFHFKIIDASSRFVKLVEVRSID